MSGNPVEQKTRGGPPAIVVHDHLVAPELVRDGRAGGGSDGIVVDDVDGRQWPAHRQGYRYPLAPAFHDVQDPDATASEQHCAVAELVA